MVAGKRQAGGVLWKRYDCIAHTRGVLLYTQSQAETGSIMVTTVGNGVIPGKLQTEMEKEVEKGANEECAMAQESFFISN